MKIDKLTKGAVKQATKQAPLRVLSDEELKQATGGAADRACCCCYRYSSSELS